jgi:hypothetical protein
MILVGNSSGGDIVEREGRRAALIMVVDHST